MPFGGKRAPFRVSCLIQTFRAPFHVCRAATNDNPYSVAKGAAGWRRLCQNNVPLQRNSIYSRTVFMNTTLVCAHTARMHPQAAHQRRRSRTRPRPRVGFPLSTLLRCTFRSLFSPFYFRRYLFRLSDTLKPYAVTYHNISAVRPPRNECSARMACTEMSKKMRESEKAAWK